MTIGRTTINIRTHYLIWHGNILQKKINKRKLSTGGGQFIAYADDIVVVAKARRVMKNIIKEIIEQIAQMGLKLNEEK